MTPANRVHVERLNRGEPILRAVEAHPWENGVVFNPGPVKGEVHRKDAVCVLFYRVQGEETAAADFRRSRLGLAVFDPELRLVRRSDDPCLVPETTAERLGHAALGVNNVVFLCGAYRYGAHLYLPYAGADSVVLAARLRWSDLLDALTALESEGKAS